MTRMNHKDQKLLGKQINSDTYQFLHLTSFGPIAVTFSGLKTWPPFEESKGHFEKAGKWWFQIFFLDDSFWMMINPYLKNGGSETNL